MAGGDRPAAVNPARPLPGALLCQLDEIAEPGAKPFYFREGEALFLGFVVRQDGRVLGYVDHCPHTGLPLAGITGRYLTREQDMLLCGVHGALFRIADGECLAGPCAGQRLTPWPVEVREAAVYVA